MSIDWDIYSDKIQNEIDSEADDLKTNFFDAYKDCIDRAVYFFLEKLVPLIDLEKKYFILRMSYQCAFDKKDTRNILFDLKEEMQEYDEGDIDRLEKLTIIFKNSIEMVEKKIKELSKEGVK